MVHSIPMDSHSGKDLPPSIRRSAVFDILAILFLVSIITLISLTILPNQDKSNENPVDYEMTMPPSIDPAPPSIDPIDPIDPIVSIDPTPSSDPITPDPKKEEEEGPLKVGDIKLPKPREAHPEDSDVDDLPFSRGMNPKREKRQTVFYRLAPFFVPLHYYVDIDVTVRGRNGADRSTVTGRALINFRAEGEASNQLEIHAEGLNLNFISLKSTRGAKFDPIYWHYNEEKRTKVWLLDKPMKDGDEYWLKVNWTAAVRSKGFHGLYETWLTSNETRYYQLATQGEVMGTRTWMPAFDEPSLKATLSLAITHPASLNARSNAPIASMKNSSIPDIRTTFFAETASISPYLYAWSLTDFPSKSTEVDGVKITVIDHSEEFLDKGLAHATSSIQSYFSALSINQSHVFEKMDFVFVPDQVSAMENVGHITFGAKYIDDRFVYVHEMMHQYFGNLITLSWWDEVWINEGLTTVYEDDAVHGVGAVVQMRSRRNQDMGRDSLRKTIPLKNEVTTEFESWGNFDKSYSKGSVVLSMLRQLIGDAAWKEGVETFLNKFAYQAVRGDDFLSTMKDVSGKYHNEETNEFAFGMAKDFFELRGFPLLTIKREGRKIELSQVRFVRGFFDDPKKENIPFATHHWRIPVYLAKLDGTPYKTVLMTSRAMTIEVETDEVLIIDPKKIIYCRTIYDVNTYKKLPESSLGYDEINWILLDLLHSSLSGYFDPSLTFDIILGDFRMKHDAQMLREILSALSTIFHFDTERHLHIYRLINYGSISADKTIPDKREYSPSECKKVTSYEGARKEYSNHRSNIKLLFCGEIKKSMGERFYEGLLESFFFGVEQIFNPKDIDEYIAHLNIHYPNLLADWTVRLSSSINDTFTEHDFASILFQIHKGFDVGHTEQLRQIFENAPRAARQNREWITRLFNERHAAISEAQQLGDKILSSLKKHLTRQQYTKSRKMFTGENKNLLNLQPERDNKPYPQYF